MLKKVKIGGLIYDIEVEKDLQGRTDDWGYIAYKETKIKLDDNLNEQLMDQVLIHEITHGILLEAGYSEHEEEMANRVGKVLYQVLKDNDFDWLRKDEEVTEIYLDNEKIQVIKSKQK